MYDNGDDNDEDDDDDDDDDDEDDDDDDEQVKRSLKSFTLAPATPTTMADKKSKLNFFIFDQQPCAQHMIRLMVRLAVSAMWWYFGIRRAG